MPAFPFQWQQILDVLIVAVLFYYIFYIFRGTKTEIVIQGIFIVAVVYYLCQLLHLITLVWIFEKILFVGSFALIIIFAPEIRHFLERAGRTRFLLRLLQPKQEQETADAVIIKVISAVRVMGERRQGGLIAFLHNDRSALEHIVLGPKIDAELSAELILTIFEPSTPLHDGAIVVEGGRVLYAGCFFPLSKRETTIRFLGTRHHAAIGITERSDVIVVVVSEETGAISLCHHGRIAYNLALDQLETLFRLLIENAVGQASVLPQLHVE